MSPAIIHSLNSLWACLAKNGSEFEKVSREKCIYFLTKACGLCLFSRQTSPWSAQLRKGEFTIVLLHLCGKAKLKPKKILGLTSAWEPAKNYSSLCHNYLTSLFCLTSSFCMLFVAHERVGRLAPNMSPNMNYFGLKFSNFRHKFLFQNYLFNFPVSWSNQKGCPPSIIPLSANMFC